jgi:hypothetical protein
VESDDWAARLPCTLKGCCNQQFADPFAALLWIDHEHTKDRPIIREDLITGPARSDMRHGADYSSAAFGNDEIATAG